MAEMDLTREGTIFVLTMRDGENRFNLAFFERFGELLDEVEAGCADGGALVVTAEGKYWSNGIDLEWLGGADREQLAAFAPAIDRFLGRILVLQVPTIAALNGHAFAGGALLAVAHDYRVMRADRGWVCFPEVDLQIPFSGGMQAMLNHKLSPTVNRDAVLTGRRYSGPEAVEAGLVDALAPEGEVLSAALKLAAPLATKGRRIMGQLKWGQWSAAAAAFGVERNT